MQRTHYFIHLMKTHIIMSAGPKSTGFVKNWRVEERQPTVIILPAILQHFLNRTGYKWHHNLHWTKIGRNTLKKDKQKNLLTWYRLWIQWTPKEPQFYLTDYSDAQIAPVNNRPWQIFPKVFCVIVCWFFLEIHLLGFFNKLYFVCKDLCMFQLLSMLTFDTKHMFLELSCYYW